MSDKMSDKMTNEMDERKFLMYYHSSMRNLGLFISVSMAILAVSRAYRGKIKIYNVGFIILTLLFLFIAGYINFYMILSLQKMDKQIKTNDYHVKELMIVPSFIMMLILFVFIFCVFTLFREMSD